jgi:5-methylcytosine-specific restriction protein A
MTRDRARYSTAWWQKLRLAVLAGEPLCRCCAAAGRVTAAAEVDHVVPLAKGGTDDWANLQPLCRPCHEAKTAIDLDAAPRGCDAAGMPVDPRHWWHGGGGGAILGRARAQTASVPQRRLPKKISRQTRQEGA